MRKVARERSSSETDETVVACCTQSGGANASSWFLYPKSKGLTEEGLARLGYSSALTFRPGVLIAPGGRQERRLAELLAVCASQPLSPSLTHLALLAEWALAPSPAFLPCRLPPSRRLQKGRATTPLHRRFPLDRDPDSRTGPCQGGPLAAGHGWRRDDATRRIQAPRRVKLRHLASRRRVTGLRPNSLGGFPPTLLEPLSPSLAPGPASVQAIIQDRCSNVGLVWRQHVLQSPQFDGQLLGTKRR